MHQWDSRRTAELYPERDGWRGAGDLSQIYGGGPTDEDEKMGSPPVPSGEVTEPMRGAGNIGATAFSETIILPDGKEIPPNIAGGLGRE